MLDLTKGKNRLIVVNMINRYRAAGDFQEWLSANNEQDFLTVPQSEIFVQAAAAGVSVVEYAPRHTAAAAILSVCNHVRELAGLPPERSF